MMSVAPFSASSRTEMSVILNDGLHSTSLSRRMERSPSACVISRGSVPLHVALDRQPSAVMIRVLMVEQHLFARHDVVEGS